MTIGEFIAALEDAKAEARAYKNQMEVNDTYAKCYEAALLKIIKLCGEEIGTNAFGTPPPDIDAVAVRAVEKLLQSQYLK